MKKKKKEKNVIISLDVFGVDCEYHYPTASHTEIPCNLEKLGITIYEMLTKEIPYYEKSTLKIIY